MIKGTLLVKVLNNRLKLYVMKLPRIIEESLKERRINQLRPPQEMSIKKGLLNGNNIVVSSPTGSGKTLVAEIAMIDHFTRGNKTLYIVPLKSLASEKFNSFKKRYSKYGVKVAVSVGDYDKEDRYLNNYDIIITTSEKADSLIRHNAEFIRRVSCVVIDEIHLIGDTDRGPTLEILITLLKEMLPNCQIIGLSATISNDKELSEWLDAELVKSNYRAVQLHEGVIFDNTIIFESKEVEIRRVGAEEENITENTIDIGKQVIFFVNSRRNAQGLAKRLAKITKKHLSKEESEKLSVIADKVLYALERPTDQCRIESELIRKGIAFHHAGLVQEQREIIEDAFRKRLLKVICATPTLAAGVNLPAFRVVVRGLTRYSQYDGIVELPVLEVKQMFGRAGRPGLEEYGEALMIAKNKAQIDFLFEKYVNGKIEEVYSKLGSEPALRTHILSLITNHFCNSLESLTQFIKKTFFAKQFNNISSIKIAIENIVSDLKHFDFIKEEDGRLKATRLGRRVCELYLDPLVADNIISSIINGKRGEVKPFAILHALCFSGGIRLLPISTKEMAKLVAIADEVRLLVGMPSPFDYEYDTFLRSIKTALLFEEWINEVDEQELANRFKVYPGDLRNFIYNIDWLLYSLTELSQILEEKRLISMSKRLRTRLAYGIRDELFTLVSIKGIGRVRARKLYNAGIKNYQDVMNAPFEKLASILGPGIARKIVKNKLL